MVVTRVRFAGGVEKSELSGEVTYRRGRNRFGRRGLEIVAAGMIGVVSGERLAEGSKFLPVVAAGEDAAETEDDDQE